eukprot:XP_006370769.2 non-specific lipid-transfer protein C, cotyledon-specific isoform [Populus trichocarpa]
MFASSSIDSSSFTSVSSLSSIPVMTADGTPMPLTGVGSVVTPHFINGAAVPCSTVDSKAAACLGFATGKAPKPTPDCCTGLQDLAKTVKTVDDKKAICKCLKAAGGSLGVK